MNKKRVTGYNYSRNRLGIYLFKIGEQEEVCKIIHQCLNKIVSQYYDKEVIKTLEHLYTPQSILDMANNRAEIWISRNNGEMDWVIALNDHELTLDEMRYRGLEIKMFYGKKRVNHYKEWGAKKAMDKAKDRMHERRLDFLTGTVLRPAWKFFEIESSDLETTSELIDAMEINSVTEKNVKFQVKKYLGLYKYKNNEVVHDVKEPILLGIN